MPYGKTLQSVDTFRIQEAYLAANFASHEISIGKSDEWFGPGRGGGMGYSNNAENIYSIRINRVEPAHIPFVSRFLGPIRYDFLYGSLQGHTATTASTRTRKGSASSLLRTSSSASSAPSSLAARATSRSRGIPSSKASSTSTTLPMPEKIGRDDPGARFSAFNFSYRLPFVRNWLTFYSDSESHDDVTPISAPRRAAIRPGIYLSHFPVRRSCRCAWRPSLPIHPPDAASAAASCTGRQSNIRRIPTKASSSGTGSAARPRAARAGSPITSAATSGWSFSIATRKRQKISCPWARLRTTSR